MTENLPHIFVINLKESADRRKQMQKRLDDVGLPFAFFEAVDGRGFDMREVPHYNGAKRRRYFGRDMMPAEMGCLLSHRGVYERMDRENIAYALILEDDVTFAPDVRGVLAALLETPVKWDVIRFLGSPKIYKRGHRKICPLTGDYWLARLRTAPGGAHAYLIRLDAARAMLKCTEHNWVPIDTLQGRTWETGLETLTVYPTPIHTDQDAGTTIGDARFDKTVQLEGFERLMFPLNRAWFKLCEGLGKRWEYWSAWRRDGACKQSS